MMTQNLFGRLFAQESSGNITPCLITGKVDLLRLLEDYLAYPHRQKPVNQKN